MATTASPIRTGYVTRSVTVGVTDQDRHVRDIAVIARNTVVYARERRRGCWEIRVPGTLFTQIVYPATLHLYPSGAAG